MRTTLYEKVFIDGFHKPSYVVVTLPLARGAPRAELERAACLTLELHPRLRSLVRTRLGVPVRLEPRPSKEWLDRGGLRFVPSADLHALEQQLLSTPMDLRPSMPLEVHVIGEPAAIVVKVHHAVIDATSGFAVLHDFARIFAGLAPREQRARAGVRSPLRRARDWMTRIQLRPRLPAISVSASYHPQKMLDHEPVEHVSRVLPKAFARLHRCARGRGATFSELVASALLSGMHQYNAQLSTRPPPHVGLMFARARPRAALTEASFRADTCVVSVPSSRLGTAHHPATLAELRVAANDRHHNDLALAALYATRKVRGRVRTPTEQRALHFTLSDVTSFGRSFGAPVSGISTTDIRVLASPTSFDHAGLLVSRFGDDVRLSLVAHRGAIDAEALLSATLEHLEKS